MKYICLSIEPPFRKLVRVPLWIGYNPVNGVHATQNDYLNNQVLRKQWGFDGIVMSDWSATYDAVEAANGGLDLEMPRAKWMNKENLMPAIKAGKVKEATIDEKM